MFVRAAGMLALVAALGADAGATIRQTECDGYKGIDNTTMTRTLYEMEPPGQGDKPCRDEKCRAQRDLACTIDALTHQLTPNTMAYNTPREAQQEFERYGRNIQALGREHPRRLPLYCKLLAQIAPTIKGVGFPKADPLDRDWLAYNVVNLAVRLDRQGNACLAQVMAAMPQTEPVQKDGAVVWGRSCLRQIKACQRLLLPPVW